MSKEKFARLLLSSVFFAGAALSADIPHSSQLNPHAERNAEETTVDGEDGDASATIPESSAASAAASVPGAAEATKHQGYERKAVFQIGLRKAKAILSNPYIPQTAVRREHVNPAVAQRTPGLQTGLFWKIQNMTCEADNSLLIDAHTSNEHSDRQQGTWRIAPNGAISAENVQLLGDKRSGVRKTRPMRFEDGSKFVANFPEKERVEGKINGVNAEIRVGKRSYDATRDEMIVETSRYSGEGHPFYGSIFSLWRQGSSGEARRLISWSPLGTDTSKFGYPLDLPGFYAGQISALTVDNEGRIFLSLHVDAHAGVAKNGANRIGRNVIYRLDEANKSMVPVLDTVLDKLYKNGRQANDPGFSERILQGVGYYADGPLNTAFIGNVALRKICFDQNNHLYVLDSSRNSSLNAVVRKIDFEKNFITTWAY